VDGGGGWKRAWPLSSAAAAPIVSRVNVNDLVKACLAAADALFERRPWQRFKNEHVILIGKSDWPHDAVASILGAAGEEHGVLFLSDRRR
jgi:hypothetical protein